MKNFTFILSLLIFTPFFANAQCVFDPTITPNNLILCPNESDTLWTQQYDSYQWFRDGSPIAGATLQYLVVDYFNDSGFEFFVAATDDNCTENSDTILVDGWAFLPPFISTEGDFTIGANGEVLVCNGDSVNLILGMPYDTNIEWTNNGVIIPGMNNDTLVVTSPGFYTASGAPSVCPNNVQGVGVEVEVVFIGPPVPIITETGGVLQTDPGYTYQWFFNGNPVGTNSNQLTSLGAGVYTVIITDISFCSAESDPYIVSSISENAGLANFFVSYDGISKYIIVERGGKTRKADLTVIDVAGRLIYSKDLSQGEQKILIPATEFLSGVYFVNISGEKEAVKVVIK